MRFDDGAVWTGEDLAAFLQADAATSGADSLFGTARHESFDGGQGDDLINGNGGGDTLAYARGDGHDIVKRPVDGSQLSIAFSDLNPADIKIARQANDMVVWVSASAAGAGDDGSIRVLDGYFFSGSRMSVSEIRFADGSVWTETEIAQAFAAALTTEGDDSVVQAGPGLTYEMGGGNDFVEAGGYDADTFVYRNGDGHDTVSERGGAYYNYDPANDVLDFADLAPSAVKWLRSGDDLIAAVAANPAAGTSAGSVTLKGVFAQYAGQSSRVDFIRFGDGSQITIADAMAASAAGAGGGAPLDYLVAPDGNVTFTYDRGDGDRLIDTLADAANDTLVLNGIAREKVSYHARGSSVEIRIAESAAGAGDGGSILVDALLDVSLANRGVETVRFADGSTISKAQIIGAVMPIAVRLFRTRSPVPPALTRSEAMAAWISSSAAMAATAMSGRAATAATRSMTGEHPAARPTGWC